jgi:hypothetical protein
MRFLAALQKIPSKEKLVKRESGGTPDSARETRALPTFTIKTGGPFPVRLFM